MSAAAPVTGSVKRRSEESERRRALLTRLLACLGGGVVLALMVGNQEGTQQDFYFAIRQALLGPRLLVFLGIGVALFLAITFRPRLVGYLHLPGFRPLGAGVLTVVVAQTLLRWSDSNQLDSVKFGSVADAASKTGGLDPLTRAFFGSVVPGTAWILLLVVGGLAFVAVARRLAVLGYVAGALAVLVGIWALSAKTAVSSFLATPDHSTGGAVCLLGWLTIGAAAVTAARSRSSEESSGDAVDRALAWRPAMPLVVLAVVVGLVSLLNATWFSPKNLTPGLSEMHGVFGPEGLDAFSLAFLQWLGYLWFVVAVVVAAAASYLRHRTLAWVAVALGVSGALATLVTTHNFTALAADQNFDGARGAWDNTGSGPWMLAAAFTLLAGTGWLVVRWLRAEQEAADDAAAGHVALHDSDTVGSGHRAHAGAMVMVLLLAGALFYPPTATPFWQTVLVTQTGIYVLLAIGLNVVVGWAGLLDLGYIAFYAIGSYATAYFTGRLPVTPPDWLTLSPLEVIPFAVAACLVAGVTLGAPTLRLRGDYLAIVTLGFGEIIRVVANNASGVTNGPQGAFNIPPPEIKAGPVDVVWNSTLGYWYLLLVLTGIVILLFTRLERSRLGRAWAAIREDEVAAQATGIDTTRVKLLAFAIGASTSGLAGVFFASQVGSFTPNNFVLNNSILVVAYVVFGGMGSLPGAMAGAAVLTWLPEFLKDQVPAEDRQMWIGALIMLMMIFRPAGLIPARRRAAELRGLDRPSSAESAAVPAGEGL